MKIALMAALLASIAVAQDNRLAPGCGPNDVSFDVKTGKSANAPGQPESDQALVYVIEDDTRFDTFPKPTVRIGLDGNWVGATHGNSYLSFAVPPGEHHLCASWQAYFLMARAGSKTTAAHLTANSGSVYYFRAKNR